jgi:hypothetical protein
MRGVRISGRPFYLMERRSNHSFQLNLLYSMLYHYCDPDEPETCPNRNDILRKFEASREAIARAVGRTLATAIEIALFLKPFTAQEIDRVLLDADLRPVAFDGQRAFGLRDVAPPARYQLVKDYQPAETARLYLEAFSRFNPAA